MFKIHLLLFSILTFTLASCDIWSQGSQGEWDSEYLPLNDAEYPYAELPRLVIETKNFSHIKDKETKISAHLQVYGKAEPISSIKELTIKGRGNSSFEMTKYGYKLKFFNKVPLLGMPKDKEWDLVPNFRDKSMVRNYVTYQLAGILGDEYNPKCQFVELYLNRQYLGIFLVVEHVKVAEHRVNIPKNDSSFLFEKTSFTSTDGQMFTSSMGYIFKFCSPKEPSQESVSLLENHINDFEHFLQTKNIYKLDSIRSWIDVEDFVRYYWIQEFSKNLDGYRRSIFITWVKNASGPTPLKMGPIWDFDLTYGASSSNKVSAEGWFIRNYGWDRFLFKNKDYKALVKDYWRKNRSTFVSILDSIDSKSEELQNAAHNEFKKWPTLQKDDAWPFIESYDSYEEAVDTLKSWIERR
ncbi:MAG: CotH kinase family protein, partial [Fibrobacteraceae bacterium]|nr:CotH kinase family protein [Fibrobacteraceae bacterium]